MHQDHIIIRTTLALIQSCFLNAEVGCNFENVSFSLGNERVFAEDYMLLCVVTMVFKHVEVTDASGIACVVQCTKYLVSHRNFTLVGAG